MSLSDNFYLATVGQHRKSFYHSSITADKAQYAGYIVNQQQVEIASLYEKEQALSQALFEELSKESTQELPQALPKELFIVAYPTTLDRTADIYQRINTHLKSLTPLESQYYCATYVQPLLITPPGKEPYFALLTQQQFISKHVNTNDPDIAQQLSQKAVKTVITAVYDPRGKGEHLLPTLKANLQLEDIQLITVREKECSLNKSYNLVLSRIDNKYYNLASVQAGYVLSDSNRKDKDYGLQMMHARYPQMMHDNFEMLEKYRNPTPYYQLRTSAIRMDAGKKLDSSLDVGSQIPSVRPVC